MRAACVSMAALAVSLALPRSDAHACSCVAPELSRDLANANVAFVGKATSRTPEPAADGSLVRGSVRYQFDVSKVFKGTVTNPVVVLTSGAGAMCGTRFDIDKSYIVFAYQNGAELDTGMCSGNLEASADNVAKLVAVAGQDGDPPSNGEPVDPKPPAPPDRNAPPPPHPNAPPGGEAGQPLTPSPQKSGCAGCATSDALGASWFVVLGLIGLGRIRRRRV